MAVSIRPIHPVFGGEVSGVDLRASLTPEEVAASAGDAPTAEQVRAA
jgi:hypothetical protein